MTDRRKSEITLKGLQERALDSHGISYCDQLLAELRSATKESLEGDSTKPYDSMAIVIEEKRSAGNLTWDDLYRLESSLLRIEPIQGLRMRVLVLRKRLENTAGTAAYATYLSSGPPDPKKADERLVRADAEYLLTELQRYLITSSAFQRAGDELSIRLLKRLLIVASVLGILILAGSLADYNITMLPIALLAGILGEFISALRRAQKMKPRGSAMEQLENISRLKLSRYYGVPIFGAIGALVVYLVFAAKLLEGPLFPDFDWQGAAPSSSDLSFEVFLSSFGPQGGTDYAKTIVWCFIAGFSERFVPDVLDSFVQRGRGESARIAKGDLEVKDGD